MKTWFTSDQHFGHVRINELAGRPFATVEEATETMVERWNANVGVRDTVYVLGDACMGDLVTSLAVIPRLNGLKFLVPGNHDRVSSLYKGSAQKKGEWNVAYREAGFRVLPEQCAMMVRSHVVMLCHFPYDGDSHGEDRYAAARPIDDGRRLLHGHTHSKEKVRGRQIHVGVDAWDFTPVSEEQLMEIISDG